MPVLPGRSRDLQDRKPFMRACCAGDVVNASRFTRHHFSLVCIDPPPQHGQGGLGQLPAR